MRPVSELAGLHAGADIWIVAAGATMDHIAPEFFAGKVSIGVNGVYRRFRTTYLIRKERKGAEEAAASGIPLIVSEYEWGGTERKNDVGTWWFPHFPNRHEPDLSVLGSDRIVVSWSTITSAMHVAAYMGAANIILCGHDCGRLDGRLNFGCYAPPADPVWYRGWLREIEAHSAQVRAGLERHYGCRVYSLNPFLNVGLEGHKWE